MFYPTLLSQPQFICQDDECDLGEELLVSSIGITEIPTTFPLGIIWDSGNVSSQDLAELMQLIDPYIDLGTSSDRFSSRNHRFCRFIFRRKIVTVSLFCQEGFSSLLSGNRLTSALNVVKYERDMVFVTVLVLCVCCVYV